MGDPHTISSAIEHEDACANRANWKLIEKDDHVEFKINAEDSTSLRAVLNSITKSLTVIEKMEKW